MSAPPGSGVASATLPAHARAGRGRIVPSPGRPRAQPTCARSKRRRQGPRNAASTLRAAALPSSAVVTRACASARAVSRISGSRSTRARNCRSDNPCCWVPKPPGSSNLEIPLRDPEAVVRLLHDPQPLRAVSPAPSSPRGARSRTGPRRGPPAPELVELREAESLRVLHHHHRRVRDVHAHLDHRRRHQDVDLARRERAHGPVLAVPLHPPVDETDPKPRSVPLSSFRANAVAALRSDFAVSSTRGTTTYACRRDRPPAGPPRTHGRGPAPRTTVAMGVLRAGARRSPTDRGRRRG